MTVKRKPISPDAALQRAMGLCARREKTHGEIREKLFAWGVARRDVEQILSKLISDGFLNEERYARAFANDKANLYHWGPRKIELALRAKGISKQNIAVAMKNLDPGKQQEAIETLIRRYSGRLKGLTRVQAKLRLARYLMGKGFDASHVWKVLGEEE